MTRLAKRPLYAKSVVRPHDREVDQGEVRYSGTKSRAEVLI